MKDCEYEGKIQEIVGLAIGEGSMCWDEPSLGIFDSVRASEIVRETVKKIIELSKDFKKGK